MKCSRIVIVLWCLALTSTAGAARFEFPASIPGFTGRPDQASFREGGPLANLLKSQDATCPHIGIYEYSDATTATAGLRGWMTSLNLQATEHARSSTTSVWTAENNDVELMGTWLAPAGGLPGRLELCAVTPGDTSGTTTHVRLRLGWILALLGGIGVVATRLGHWTDRIRGIQPDVRAQDGPIE